MSPLPSLPLEAQYAHFSPSLREEMLAETKRMFQVGSQQSSCGRKVDDRLHFQHGYDNYMQHAWPLDELNPLACCGRGLASFFFFSHFQRWCSGPDTENPDNININDVLGDFSLTLIDSLDTLAGEECCQGN